MGSVCSSQFKTLLNLLVAILLDFNVYLTNQFKEIVFNANSLRQYVGLSQI